MLTDYEINYNTDLQTESAKVYSDAMEARKAEKAKDTDKVLQTGNTGPAGSTPSFDDDLTQAFDAAQRKLASESDYLEFLRFTYPDTLFTMGDFSGEATELIGLGGIMLSEGLFRKMIDDPKFGTKMEESIGEIANAERDLNIWYETNNVNVLGHGAIIDAEGQARTWSFVLEDLNSMQKLGSTDNFMKMEALREKAMQLDIETPLDIEENRNHLHYKD